MYLQEYLRRFYRLAVDGGQRSRRDTVAFENKVRQMQEFFGLDATGQLDQPTLTEMKTARCGVPDVENYSFHPDRPKWRNHTITYRFVLTPPTANEKFDGHTCVRKRDSKLYIMPGPNFVSVCY